MRRLSLFVAAIVMGGLFAAPVISTVGAGRPAERDAGEQRKPGRTTALGSPDPATHIFYFHGQPSDQAAKASGPPYTATFNSTPPTGSQPVVQSASTVADSNQPNDPTGAFWVAPFSGTINDTVELRIWVQAPNPEAQLLAAAADVNVFADPQYMNASAGTGTKIGTALGNFTVGPTPTLAVIDVPVSGTVTSNLLIQIIPHFTDGDQGQTYLYDSATMPSQFLYPAPVQSSPGVTFPTDQPVAFGPATIVSAHFEGAEPQTTVERPTPQSPAGVLDPNRIFVDWPLDTEHQISQLSRSTDGGDSFRLLMDPTCFNRSRPNCNSAGGGDSEETVNPVTGDLYFGDQEEVGQEAIVSSTDHGDTFPVARQFAFSSPSSGVDRQWLAPTTPGLATATDGQGVNAFYSYHVPAAGMYVIGIAADGSPIPQPAPQIPSVSQGGQMRVDMTDGPGRGWIYQPYRTTGYKVATADSRSYQLPSDWKSTPVSTTTPDIFPWLDLDSHGNAYAVWVTDGVLYYAFSKIDDPANNPLATPPGRPGTSWSLPTRISPPSIGSAVFPSVAAGDPGRVAVAFVGTPDFVGKSDGAPATAQWQTYSIVLSNALNDGRQPIEARMGQVSHRVVHLGSVCTSGTTCTGDRSLLDTIDLGVDSDGRASVVFMDNNSQVQVNSGSYLSPFTHFAKQVSGPSMLAAKPAINVTIPTNARADAAGDATWPNQANAPNLKSLDELGASLYVSGSELVGRIPLADASPATMQSDLAAYNAAGYSPPTGNRLQYILRFSTTASAITNSTMGDIFHMSLEVLSDGTQRFFGGKLDSNDNVLETPRTPSLIAAGAAYHTDAGYHVTGTVDPATNTIELRAPLADFGLVAGDKVLSVTGFAAAGPTETLDRYIQTPLRTVDATPPFDGTLQAAPTGPAAVLDVTPAAGFAPLATVLDSSGSTPGSNPITSRTYTFGDGSASVTTAATLVPHTYATVGTYTASVTVTDSASRSASATQVVRVRSAPSAVLAATPRSGVAPLAVSFDASGSNLGVDANGNAARATGYDFDFGDGSSTHSGDPHVSHTYSKAGTFSATVRFTNTNGDSATSSPVAIAVAAPPPATGYWLVAKDGGIFNYGDAGFFGSTGDIHLEHPMVAMAARPQHDGYWLVSSAGEIFAFGSARSFGSMGGHPLNAPIVGITASPSGNGYVLVASDGGVFNFGDARLHGSMGGQPLNSPIVGIAATGGDGYVMAAADGGVFAFGDAVFHGSMGGQHLNAPIVGVVVRPGSSGYWLAANDGGVFAFGAPFYGSEGGHRLNQPINAISTVTAGDGYRFGAADGGVFTFGPGAPFKGSHGGSPIKEPVAGMQGF